MTSALATACQPAIVRRAFIMAAVVGPILTLINQGDALFSDVPFNFWKAGLTFAVPYLVATASAVFTQRHRAPAEGPQPCLDPQGKAIAGALASLGFDGIGEIRQGKVIDLEIDGADQAEAREKVDAMCRKLLANTVIEDYAIELEA
jgi:phosphoribosylformylglycinamidine synthase